MPEERIILILKVFIGIGLSLLLLGHYLIEYAELPEKMGVNGMVISAACIAFGLVFSLPTKMYLTFLLVKRESDKKETLQAGPLTNKKSENIELENNQLHNYKSENNRDEDNYRSRQ